MPKPAIKRIKQRSTLASLEYGFARLLDFSGSLITFTYEKHPSSADAAAISFDWKRVSGNIYKVMCLQQQQNN